MKPSDGKESTSTVDTTHRPAKSSIRWTLLASGPIAWLLFLLLLRRPSIAEDLYAQGLGAWIGLALGRISGLFPFALSEIVLALALVSLGVRVGVLFRRRPLWKSALRTLLDLATAASAIFALFYLVWGFHYARPALPDRDAWPPLDADVQELLLALADESVPAVNDAYRALHGTEDLGAPTPWPASLPDLDQALDAAWSELPAGDLHAMGRARRGRAKGLRISPLLHRLGLSGFYFPFTGEANFNRTLPAMRLPCVIAHEKAHQRGVASEDEANFYGWWTASRAVHPLARYSAALFAHRRIVSELARRDPQAAQQRIAQRLPGVQRDVDDLYRYWREHDGPARNLSRNVNHAYLRGHHVQGGIESYGRVLQLLLRHADRQGGTLTAGS